MKTYKYPLGKQSNTIRIGNLLDDMWQVHEYFHKWQRQRYKDELPYVNYRAMSAHLTELKRTTHPHWKALPSQAIQTEGEAMSVIENAPVSSVSDSCGRMATLTPETGFPFSSTTLPERLAATLGQGCQKQKYNTSDET